MKSLSASFDDDEPSVAPDELGFIRDLTLVAPIRSW
jgi:hypothetical protein